MRRALLTAAVLTVMLVASGTAGGPTVVSVALTSAAIEPLTDALTTVSLLPSKDNTLYESATGSLSNGAGQHFFAGRTNGGSIRRAVVAFDVAGTILAGSTINSATLSLNMSRTSSGAQTVSLHSILADWGEGTSDASFNEGGGTTATTNDATWTHRFFDTAFWTSPGGDFSATGSGSTSVAGAGSYNWSSAQMVTDVQGWLDDPTGNFGWLLKGNESTVQTTKRFDSKENGTDANRPKLTVQYTPPTPVPGLTLWGLLALAGVMTILFWTRLRRSAHGAVVRVSFGMVHI